jgi:hypothetical protein
MKKQNNPVAVLIDNIKADQQLLGEKTKILEEAKVEKNEIVARIKEHRKDVAHMWKYMSDAQKAEIESLGLDVAEQTGKRGVLNPVSQIAYDVIMKAKGNKMTNRELFAGYIDSLPTDEDALTYTAFNIKIRQLFNSGRFTKEQIDPNKSGRDDVITLHLDSSEK